MAAIVLPFADPPAEGRAVEIAAGVLWMRLPLPMALDHVNVFAFDGPEGWTVIDTGFDTRQSRRIWQRLLDGPLAGRPVVRLIVTHHHPDHIGLAGWFQAQGAELLTSRTAWLMARMLVLDEQKRPSPESLEFWRRAGMPSALLAKRAAERPFNFADVVHPLPLGYRRIGDGDHLQFGGREWLVRVGHGHAPEHLTLWSQTDGLVIGGDQLLPSISPNLGVYPTEPDADPVAEWLAACRSFATFATSDHLVLPGHKLPYQGLDHRLGQLIDNHESALTRLRDALTIAPRTAVGCFDILFRRPIGDGELGLALVEAVAHINHLRHQNLIHAVGETDGAVLWGA